MGEEVTVAGMPAEDAQIHLFVLALLGVAKRIREENLDVPGEADVDEGGDDA